VSLDSSLWKIAAAKFYVYICVILTMLLVTLLFDRPSFT
jgi:hypothetical protein